MAAPASSTTAGGDLVERLVALHDRLLEHYGPPPPRVLQDPLSELIQTVLSQNTADVNSDRAYASLTQRFGGDWEAVRAAPVSDIADGIRSGGLAEIKAARIKSILERIVERTGELDLSFLREAPLDEARAFLRSLGGVGPKTAACVLLFACGKPALPVDTHVHRVSQRLGLVPEKATADQAHALLEAIVPEELVYSFHMLLIGHGRQICKAQRPRCFECPVADLCPRVGLGGKGLGKESGVAGREQSQSAPHDRAVKEKQRSPSDSHQPNGKARERASLSRVAHAGPQPPTPNPAPNPPSQTPQSPTAPTQQSPEATA